MTNFNCTEPLIRQLVNLGGTHNHLGTVTDTAFLSGAGKAGRDAAGVFSSGISSPYHHLAYQGDSRVPETLRRGTVAPPIACLTATLRQQTDPNRETDHPRPQREALGTGIPKGRDSHCGGRATDSVLRRPQMTKTHSAWSDGPGAGEPTGGSPPSTCPPIRSLTRTPRNAETPASP